VWEHPRNAELRARRSNPNVLLPGDELFLPVLREREESCATARTHTFQRKGVPSSLLLRCLDLHGEPRAGEVFRVLATGFERAGKLDGDGWLRLRVPPDLREVEVIVGEEKTDMETRYQLRVGHLDPIDTLTGVCDRLHNLGYYHGPPLAEPDGPLRQAVARFRADAALPAGSAVDGPFRDALKQRHGA
jgi:hypothetical protein